MPAPRGSRGGARGARGGSRGGRGGAAAASTSQQQEQSHAEEEGAQGTRDGETAGTATVIDSTESSAANTPAPSTTGTPGPSSSAAGTPSSTTGAAAVATTTSSSRGGGLSRFRPKNVRRDAEERKKLEEQRNRDLAAKIKVEERELAKEERRARRGRGRGDAMSQRGTMRRNVTATGPFSAIPAENVKGGGSGAWGWSGGAGGGRGGASNKGGFGGGGDRSDSQRYRPRREHESRVNIEVLSGFAEDDEGKPLYYSSRSNGAHPVGLFRTEHEDEIVKVATTAELEAEEQESDDDGDLFVPGVVPAGVDDGGGGSSMKDDNEIWHAAPTGAAAAGGVAVKPEPGTEGETMDVDMADIPEATTSSSSTVVKPPPSPELAKKKAALAAVAADPSKEKKREKALQDPEVQHQLYDMQTLLQELSFHDADQPETSGQDKEGRLYLFQLPPILPPLVKPNADGSIDTTTPVDLDTEKSTNNAKVKSEDGGDEANQDSANSGELPFPPEGGYIGKLVVRKSGKVSLDWGGTRLDLGMATETDFLTSSVLLETKDHPEQPDMVVGSAAGMGQVMGKFVLTPVWDEEEDWNPSLEGIELAAADQEE